MQSPQAAKKPPADRGTRTARPQVARSEVFHTHDRGAAWLWIAGH